MGAMSAAALCLGLVGTTAAFAAENKYANKLPVAEGVSYSSGILSRVTGGAVQVDGLVFATQYISTSSPPPGQTVYGSASGSGGLKTGLTHGNAYNAESKCTWRWNGAGGTAGMDCWYRN